MTIEELVQLLRETPEVRLKILGLARELLDPQGNLDPVLALEKASEVALAIREASEYATATEAMVNLLWSSQYNRRL